MLASGFGGLGGGAPQSAAAAFPRPGSGFPLPRALAGDNRLALEDPSPSSEVVRQGEAGSAGAVVRTAPVPVSAPAQAGKRGPRFDAAIAIAKAKRKAAQAGKKVFGAVRMAEAALSASVATFQLLPADQQAESCSEFITGQHCLEFMRAVLAPDECPASAGNSLGNRPLANLTDDVVSGRMLPPCDEWLSLVTLTTASAMEHEAFAALDIAQCAEEAQPTLFARSKS